VCSHLEEFIVAGEFTLTYSTELSNTPGTGIASPLIALQWLKLFQVFDQFDIDLYFFLKIISKRQYQNIYLV
jgi:hypothetical protein